MIAFITQHFKTISIFIGVVVGTVFVVREQLVSKLTGSFHNTVVAVENAINGVFGHIFGSTPAAVVPVSTPASAPTVIPAVAKAVIPASVPVAIPVVPSYPTYPSGAYEAALKANATAGSAESQAEAVRSQAASALVFAQGGDKTSPVVVQYNAAAYITPAEAIAYYKGYWGI